MTSKVQYCMKIGKVICLIILISCCKLAFAQETSEKEYADIVRYCSQILKKDSNNIECLNGRAYAYYMLSYNDSAILDYLHVLRIKPELDDALYNLGLAYNQSGNFKSSIKILKKCIDKNINKSEANFYVANSYFDLEQYENARRYYLESAKLDKKHELTAFSNIGLSYMLEKNYKNAIVYFDKALKIDSLKINCLYYRGFSYLNLNSFEKAEIDILKTLKIDSADPYGNVFYSILLCKKGRREESLKYSNIAKEINVKVFNFYHSYNECN